MSAEAARRPVAVVTGANTGIGFHAAGLLASRGYEVVLGCRNLEKAEQAVREIRQKYGSEVTASVEHLDLVSFASVRDCARSLGAKYDKLEVLVCNGGLNSESVSQNPQEQLSKDGVDVLYQTNTLSHLLLTLLLVPLLEAASGRVVSLTSVMHRHASPGQLALVRQMREPYVSLYALSKLAQIAASEELHRRFAGRGIAFHTVNPGGVASDIWRNYPVWQRWAMSAVLVSPERAAQTVVQACTCAEGAAPASPKYWNGYFGAARLTLFEYAGPVGAGGASVESVPSDVARDPGFGGEFWEESVTALRAAGVMISSDGKVES